MARIRLGVLVSDIRGSIQGSTFQRTNSGLVLKSIGKKVNRLTDSSLVVRSIMNNAQIEWLNIGNDNRDIWKSFANYSKVKQKNSSEFILNGQQLFIKINTLRKLYNLSVLVVPEFSKCIILPITITASLNVSDLVLETNRLIDSNVEFLSISATIPVSITINNAGSRFKAILFTTLTGTTHNIGSEYLATLSASLNIGDTIFIKYTTVNKLTGISMPLQTLKVTLT